MVGWEPTLRLLALRQNLIFQDEEAQLFRLTSLLRLGTEILEGLPPS